MTLHVKYLNSARHTVKAHYMIIVVIFIKFAKRLFVPQYCFFHLGNECHMSIIESSL